MTDAPSLELEHRIVNIALNEIATTAGFKPPERGARLLEPIIGKPLNKFAKLFAKIDEIVGEGGLQPGLAWALPHFTQGIEVHNGEKIPLSGAVLVISNHPGGTETLALPAALPKREMYLVTNPLPFLQALPNIQKYAVFVTEGHPVDAIFKTTSLLKAGKLVTLFPQGYLEPDPALLPGAELGFESWSTSIGLFLKTVPDLVIVPTIVSGVLNKKAYQNLLLKSFKTQFQRQKMANYLQVVAKLINLRWYPIRPVITFGAPFQLRDLTTGGDIHPIELTQLALARIKPVLSQVSTEEQLHEHLPLAYRWM
ncbi:MAG: hypothetical protein HPY76_05970 [Anaerolineae bacterium]|nr:hypothetical protein [Anaerolineae bacterium]